VSAGRGSPAPKPAVDILERKRDAKEGESVVVVDGAIVVIGGMIRVEDGEVVRVVTVFPSLVGD
jgi:hypothetical protein